MAGEEQPRAERSCLHQFVDDKTELGELPSSACLPPPPPSHAHSSYGPSVVPRFAGGFSSTKSAAAAPGPHGPGKAGEPRRWGSRLPVHQPHPSVRVARPPRPPHAPCVYHTDDHEAQTQASASSASVLQVGQGSPGRGQRSTCLRPVPPGFLRGFRLPTLPTAVMAGRGVPSLSKRPPSTQSADPPSLFCTWMNLGPHPCSSRMGLKAKTGCGPHWPRSMHCGRIRAYV